MINLLKILPSFEDTAATLTEVEIRVKAQHVEIEQARNDFRAAALAVVEGAEGAAIERDKAWRRIGHAERALAEAEAALTLAQRRHIESTDRRTVAETAHRWAQAEKLTKEREALGRSIERLTVELHDKFRSFTAMSAELCRVAPGADANWIQEVLSPWRSELALKAYIFKAGFRSAQPSAIVTSGDVQTFSQYVIESNGAVLAQRERHGALPGHNVADAPAPAQAHS